MDRKLGGLIFLLLAIPAGAKEPPLLKETASGKAEATMPSISVDEVRNALVLGCTQNGMDIEPGQFTLICSQLKQGGKGVLAQALLGNSFSGKPYDKVKFTFAQAGENVFVTAESYMEMTMGFGEIKRIVYTNNRVRNDLQAGLDAAAQNLANRNATQAPRPGAQATPLPTSPTSGEMKYRPKGW